MTAPNSTGEPPSSPARDRLRRVGLFAGPLLALFVAWLLPSEYRAVSGDVVALSAAARATAALAAWMAVWWMTEAIPVYATALLPLGLLPLLGAGTAREATAPYGNETIFLFLGGFLMALSMQRWGLDRRIAFGVLRIFKTRAGARADVLVLGVMGVTAFLSLWVSNTATALTMYPVALSVLALGRAGRAEGEKDEDPAADPAFRNLAHALLLGVAYAASIGGLGTVTATPPNLFLASFARENLGVEIGFARWMLFGIPLVLVFLPAAWWLLMRVFPMRGLRVQGVEALAEGALKDMGPLSRGEKATLAAFGFAVAGWVFRPLLAKVSVAGLHPFAGLTDSGIAILAGLSLFTLSSGRAGRGVRENSGSGSSGRVMDWDAAKGVPFGLLLLFGGGLSLAAAIERNGVGDFLGGQMGGLQGMPVWAFLTVVVLGIVFLGELLSNTAMAATMIPVCAVAAAAMGLDPMVVLIPVTCAASCGFMLPVATPPNAIVYGSGHVDAQAMIRAGFWLNLIGAALVLLVTSFLAGRVF